MPKEPTPPEKIKSLRDTLGMNQEAFAKELEVDQGVVSRWERGEYAPSVESYVKLMKLAAKHNLNSEVVWFAAEASINLSEMASVFVKERNAVYSQALGEAQALSPN